jgi:rubrerythrin
MDLQEALACALEVEQKVRDHYGDCAMRIQAPLGKKVFETLAREEQGHVEYLQCRLAEWKETGAFTASALPSVLPSPAWIREAGGKIAASALAPGGSTGRAHQPERIFLEEALALEHMTNAFYQDLVDNLEPAHRELFFGFLDIEDGHLALVQAELDALAGHGHWFDFTDLNPGE